MKPYSKKVVDDLNEIQKDFIWRGRKPKIKHTSLIGDYSEGSMKNIDMKAKLESLRIQWVQRLTNNNFHSLKIIPNVLLKNVGGVSLFHSNLALSDACKLKINIIQNFTKASLTYGSEYLPQIHKVNMTFLCKLCGTTSILSRILSEGY